MNKIRSSRALARAKAHVVHTLASMMFVHHISFDKAMSPEYHDQRWELMLKNGAREEHKDQLLGFTKTDLVG